MENKLSASYIDILLRVFSIHKINLCTCYKATSSLLKASQCKTFVIFWYVLSCILCLWKIHISSKLLNHHIERCLIHKISWAEDKFKGKLDTRTNGNLKIFFPQLLHDSLIVSWKCSIKISLAICQSVNYVRSKYKIVPLPLVPPSSKYTRCSIDK